MGRNGASFNRPQPRFRAQPSTLVICEDRKSSPQYLREAAQYFRSSADVEVIHCEKTDPKGIIKEALVRRGKYDRVYCVIDRDQHENFEEALALTRDSKLEVIASYPCYEFWLLLHFRKTRKPFNSAGKQSGGERLIRELRKEPEMADYAKGKPAGLFHLLLPRLADARRWSAAVLLEARAEGELNPSTRMHELIEHLEALGKPIPIP